MYRQTRTGEWEGFVGLHCSTFLPASLYRKARLLTARTGRHFGVRKVIYHSLRR